MSPRGRILGNGAHLALNVAGSAAATGLVLATVHHLTPVLLKQAASFVPALICGSTTASNVWVNSEPLFTTILPLIGNSTNMTYIAGACALMWLLVRRVHAGRGFVGLLVETTKIAFTALILTTVLLLGFASMRTAFAPDSRATGTPLDAYKCPDVAKRLQDLIAPEERPGAWLDILVNPPPPTAPAELFTAADMAQVPLAEFVAGVYSKIYPPVMFAMKLLEPYLVYVYLGLGLVWSIPALEASSGLYEAPMSLILAAGMHALYHQRSLEKLQDTTQLRAPTLPELGLYAYEYFAFFGFFVIGLTLVKLIARVSSRRIAIPGLIALWTRVHSLGLPWLGLHVEAFSVVFLIVALFSGCGTHPGLFLIVASVARLYPGVIPPFYLEIYVALLLGYNAFLPLLTRNPRPHHHRPHKPADKATAKAQAKQKKTQ
eukprot:TRINITY_DN563_c0_g1_i3.p1 TRINITY_DN563_c0_g1~~TRINITY_DN563_c0_g1_i3.p1  ORF type:complete len:441 (+),score=116.33 TRINITY_DN563_c0_g1_i3:29-1324(+)